MVLPIAGCFTLNHVVGDGAKGNTVVDARQWYILWGLVPLNTVDSKTMAGGVKDYTVKSQHTVLDFVMNIFTGFVTVYSQTVEVRK
jgi:hypothetical protein